MQDSNYYLSLLAEQEKISKNRIAGVRTVLVVLSAAGMVYDRDSLRQKILLSYPEAAVFFWTTSGKPIGAAAPGHLDLLIDLTGPRQRQGLFLSKKLRRMARVAVGRNCGFFRNRIYDRVFNEKSPANAASLPKDILVKERFVQREVLALAGIALVPSGDTPVDRGQTIALELPPLARS